MVKKKKNNDQTMNTFPPVTSTGYHDPKNKTHGCLIGFI